jgi:hypothetical protein
MISVANIKKHEPYDLYIGRANKWLELECSKWHNPFVLKRESDRPAILEQYREYVISSGLINDIDELEGLVLGCYCRPKRCHGNVLQDLYAEKHAIFK